MTMKPLGKNILIGLAIVAVLAGLFVLGALFGGRKNNDQKYFDLLIAEKDKQIKSEQEHRKETTAIFNQLIDEIHRKDSLLAERSKVNTIRYEKIPVTVASYSDDELRRAVLERYND